MTQPPSPGTSIPVKLTDDVLGGVYSNSMQVSHTREEFVLDFMSIFPPAGKVNSRVIISPGHMKRVIDALTDNLRKFEQQYGSAREIEPKDQVFH